MTIHSRNLLVKDEGSKIVYPDLAELHQAILRNIFGDLFLK